MAEKTKKKSSKKAESSKDNSICEEKKLSMKTATDVISRLLWDDSLPQDKFVVGYLDRFNGITEKPFTSLDWRDPATVDNYTLALPKHRIQYFKYLNRKVWDKRYRTDIVFGSTGYPLSIYDFMYRVDDDILNFQDEDVIPEQIGPQITSASADETVSDKEFDMSERSNFFIAVRITNENTVQSLKEVSDYIKIKDELLGECCIPPEMFHLTLSILKLDSPNDISNAVEALQSVAKYDLPPVVINLEGLDNFEQRVLYSRVAENENLMNLRKTLVNELVSRKVNITDKFSFVPHITVAKLSRPIQRIRHSNYIDQYLYLQFEDNEFGEQKISDLYLCEMGSARREDGFYSCALEIPLKI